jgi:hypothetical protein
MILGSRALCGIFTAQPACVQEGRVVSFAAIFAGPGIFGASTKIARAAYWEHFLSSDREYMKGDLNAILKKPQSA